VQRQAQHAPARQAQRLEQFPPSGWGHHGPSADGQIFVRHINLPPLPARWWVEWLPCAGNWEAAANPARGEDHSGARCRRFRRQSAGTSPHSSAIPPISPYAGIPHWCCTVWQTLL